MATLIGNRNLISGCPVNTRCKFSWVTPGRPQVVLPSKGMLPLRHLLLHPRLPRRQPAPQPRPAHLRRRPHPLRVRHRHLHKRRPTPRRPESRRQRRRDLPDELTRERVGDARIEVTFTRTRPPGIAFTGKLELMKRGSPATYGTMVTIDPLAEYTLELTIRRPDHAEPSRARFGPARIPLSGSHGDLRKPPATDTK